MHVKNQKVAMHIYAIIAIHLWALGYVLTRVAVRHFTPEAVSFLRYLVAATSLLLFATAKKMRLPKLRDVPLLFLGGAIGFAVYVYMINLGSQTLEASNISFIVSTAPIITALLARIVLHEKMGLLGWLSVLCAFTGVGIITLFDGGFAFTSGAIWICFAAILVSTYNIYQRKLLRRYSPLEITTYCVIAGALLLSVFAPQSFPQLLNAEPIGIAVIIILGMFSAGIAYACWACALSLAEKTSEVTNYMFVTPIITTILGLVLIGEIPGISVFIGGFLVLMGVVLINKRKTL